jgi:hypothetical protein
MRPVSYGALIALVALSYNAVVASAASPNQGPAAVDVTNSQEIGTDTAKAFARQPVHFELFSDQVNQDEMTYVVPANKRLVIEYASGSCNNVFNLTIGSLSIDVSNTNFRFPYYLNFPPLTDSGSVSIQNFGHVVQIYAEAGDTVHLVASAFNSGVGGHFFVLASCLADWSMFRKEPI